MKRAAFLLFAAALLAGLVVSRTPASGQSGADSSPINGIKLPDGYRHWEMVSIAQVGPPLNDLRVKLGNDVAMKAFRGNTRPFPDRTIIARLAYQQVTSEENNKVFRAAAEKMGLPPDQIEKLLAGSTVAGSPTNVQFMVKDWKKIRLHRRMGIRSIHERQI